MNKIIDADSLYMARMVRQLPIFGIEGQKRIAETPVAIVGSGGNGSLMSLVCALVGFLVIDLFDPDKWEIHNLNRSPLAGAGDIGRHKVMVVKERLESMFPEVQVGAFTESIQTPGMWERARECSWILDCCDSYPTREYLQKKCSQDNKRMISIASGFRTQDNNVIGGGCRANLIGNGDGCLRCQALAEGLTEYAHISLVTVNLFAVALGMDFLLRQVTGYDKPDTDGIGRIPTDGGNTTATSNVGNSVLFDLFSRTLTCEHIVPTPGCLYCGNDCDK